MTTLFVGLDLGSRYCQLVAMNAEGSVITNRRFPTSEANLLTAVKELGGDLHLHIEAGELAAWVRSVLAPRVARLVVSHPCANAWIAKDPNKSDRVDARKAEAVRHPARRSSPPKPRECGSVGPERCALDLRLSYLSKGTEKSCMKSRISSRISPRRQASLLAAALITDSSGCAFFARPLLH
jgi:hypothetical protein